MSSYHLPSLDASFVKCCHDALCNEGIDSGKASEDRQEIINIDKGSCQRFRQICADLLELFFSISSWRAKNESDGA